VPILIWVCFVVALGSSIEIGATSLMARALGTLVLASPVMAGATRTMVVSQHGRVGWGGVSDLVDLDLSRLDVRDDLFDL
jgi:hypothetical protein